MKRSGLGHRRARVFVGCLRRFVGWRRFASADRTYFAAMASRSETVSARSLQFMLECSPRLSPQIGTQSCRAAALARFFAPSALTVTQRTPSPPESLCCLHRYRLLVTRAGPPRRQAGRGAHRRPGFSRDRLLRRSHRVPLVLLVVPLPGTIDSDGLVSLFFSVGAWVLCGIAL
jgi:hypothetical protein